MKLIKKIILIIIILNTLSFYCFADDFDDDELDYINTLEVSSEGTNLTLNSNYVLVLERSTNTVLFEKNGYEKTAMASTTKIMTAIIALETCNLTDIVTISSQAAHTGGSTLGIYSNTQMTMESLLYGLLLRSGNDCAVAIAEHISGNLDGFAKLMNQKAKELNLNNTNFVTPHGLDSQNHFTTAYDLALLTNYALENKTFSKIVGTQAYQLTIENNSRTLHNTNELLRLYLWSLWS